MRRCGPRGLWLGEADGHGLSPANTGSLARAIAAPSSREGIDSGSGRGVPLGGDLHRNGRNHLETDVLGTRYVLTSGELELCEDTNWSPTNTAREHARWCYLSLARTTCTPDASRTPR